MDQSEDYDTIEKEVLENVLEDSISRTDKTKQQTTDLQKENIELRIQNRQMKNEIQQLKLKLQSEMRKGKDNALTIESEYLNCQKMLLLYKKQIKSLKAKLIDQPQTEVEKLQSLLRDKDRQIQILKSQVKGLKRLNHYQQKGLVQAAGEGVLQCYKDYEHLSEEYRKLQRKCDEYEKQLRKKINSQKVIEIHAQEDLKQLETYQKQVEVLKVLESKHKKHIYNLTKEMDKLNQDKQNLQSELRTRDVELQRSRQKLVEFRKHMQPRKVTEATLENLESSRNRKKRINTLPNVMASQMRYVSLPKIINYDRTPKAKSYQIVYPKIDYRGDSNADSQVWNDISVASKIIEIDVLVDSHNFISSVNARYEKGTTIESSRDMNNHNRFKCKDKEFVQFVSGGFLEGLLQFLVVITNQKRKVKFGVESAGCAKFDFNINDNEYPCALFGESCFVGQTKRLNKFGVFIERL